MRGPASMHMPLSQHCPVHTHSPSPLNYNHKLKNNTAGNLTFSHDSLQHRRWIMVAIVQSFQLLAQIANVGAIAREPPPFRCDRLAANCRPAAGKLLTDVRRGFAPFGRLATKNGR